MNEPSMTDTLAAMRAIEQAASEGPWEINGAGEYVSGVGLMVAPDDGGVSGANAEFIAAARAFVPKALAALDAVLALHPMETMQVLDREDCARDECGHAGECPTVSFDICRGCFDRAMEIYMYYAGGDISRVAYPCPDVVAIEKAFTT